MGRVQAKRAKGKSQAAEAALDAIDRLDHQAAINEDISSIVAVAADITGREVGVEDFLNEGYVQRSAESRLERDPARAEAIERLVIQNQLGPGETEVFVVDGTELLVSGVAGVSGHIGFVYLIRGSSSWTLLDHMVAKRLAREAAVYALSHSRRGIAAFPADLERLLAGGISEEEGSACARRAGFPPHLRLRVCVIRSFGNSKDLGPELCASVVARSCKHHRVRARTTSLVDVPVAVVAAEDNWHAAMADIVEGARAYDVTTIVGCGRPRPPHLLRDSLTEAKEAASLWPALSTPDQIVQFEKLGPLRLLALIPPEELAADPDVAALRELTGCSAGVSDIDLLEVFCELGSLRKAGQKLCLHHSSVQYRLKRIEQLLGYELESGSNRMRALLAVRLIRIEQTRRDSSWSFFESDEVAVLPAEEPVGP